MYMYTCVVGVCFVHAAAYASGSGLHASMCPCRFSKLTLLNALSGVDKPNGITDAPPICRKKGGEKKHTTHFLDTLCDFHHQKNIFF